MGHRCRRPDADQTQPPAGSGGPEKNVRRAVSGADRVYLARHGQTALNAERRLRGLSNPPLDEVGIAEAARLAEVLAAKKPTVVISSPLQRAVATAQAIASAAGVGIIVDERPNDRDYGPMTGQRRADVEARFGSIDAAPGVEPLGVLAERAHSAFLELVDENGPGPIAWCPMMRSTVPCSRRSIRRSPASGSAPHAGTSSRVPTGRGRSMPTTSNPPDPSSHVARAAVQEPHQHILGTVVLERIHMQAIPAGMVVAGAHRSCRWATRPVQGIGPADVRVLHRLRRGVVRHTFREFRLPLTARWASPLSTI